MSRYASLLNDYTCSPFEFAPTMKYCCEKFLLPPEAAEVLDEVPIALHICIVLVEEILLNR